MSQADESHGELLSLLFWPCLLTALVLGAVVALSPRLVVRAELEEHYVRNQARLVALQGEVRQLERVAAALERDPDFAAELARFERDPAADGHERLRVGPALAFDPRLPRKTGPAGAPAAPWFLPLVRAVAEDGTLRSRLWYASAGLLLFAFVFLHPGALRQAAASGRGRGLVRLLLGRYVKDPASDVRVAAERTGFRLGAQRVPPRQTL